MKNLKLIRYFFALLGSMLWLCNASAQTTFPLTGRAYSPSGQPIAGATITFSVEGYEPFTVVSTGDGSFNSVRQFRAGLKFSIQVNAPRYEVYQNTYTIATGRIGRVTLRTAVSPAVPVPGIPLISIKAIVKSDQGDLLRDALITINDPIQGKNLVKNVSDFRGELKTEPLFKKGQKVEISVEKRGYGSETRTITVNGPIETVENFVLETKLYVVGYVTDSISGQPVRGVEVSFFDNIGRSITPQKTNQKGYYEFDVPFVPGQQIRVRADGPKEDGRDIYAPIEQILRIVIPGAENRLDFIIPKWEDRGIKFEVRVYNKRRKPLSGVQVYYFDRSQQSFLTPETGSVILNIKKKPGDEVGFRLLKPGYKEANFEIIMKKTFDYKSIILEKDVSKCPCWLYAGIGLAATSLTTNIMRNASYLEYENFKNLDRESDYMDARREGRATIVAGGLAAVSLSAFVYCKIRETNKYQTPEEISQRSRFKITPWSAPSTHYGAVLGLAYQF